MGEGLGVHPAARHMCLPVILAATTVRTPSDLASASTSTRPFSGEPGSEKPVAAMSKSLTATVALMGVRSDCCAIGPMVPLASTVPPPGTVAENS